MTEKFKLPDLDELHNSRSENPTHQPSILRKWSVENFKSLGYAEVSTLPLSLITGPNSAGKSSFIQSLLLFAQSTGHDITLNGPLVSLGTATDVITHGFDSATLEFSLVETKKVACPLKEDTVHVRITLEADGHNLRVSQYSIATESEQIISAQRGRVPEGYDIAFNNSDLRGEVLEVSVLNGEDSLSNTYLTVRGFLPESLLVAEDDEQFLKRALKFVGAREFSETDPEIAWLEVFLQDAYDTGGPKHDLAAEFDAVFEWIDLYGVNPESLVHASRTNLMPLLLRFIAFAPRFLGVAAMPIGRSGTFRESGVFDLADTPNRDFIPTLSFLDWVRDLTVRAASEIQYLGPLRTNPQILEAPGIIPANAPVGTRGEFSAQAMVDDAQRPLLDFGERSQLQLDLHHWVNKLKIAQSVLVADYGKLGSGLRIVIDGEDFDLTSVGVGASQLIPLLVLILSAKPGALLLVEQPELHLHPAVQSELGDLFLQGRRQASLLTETHSEYLVTRIRRRVAEGSIDPAKVGLYFAEKHDGTNELVRLNLNDFGNLNRWPSGFFDSQDKDILALIEAVNAIYEDDEK